MKEQIITFGKYQGQKLSEIPLDYIEWLLRQGNVKIFRDWILESRFKPHTHFESHTSKDKRWMAQKLPDGYIFYIDKIKSSTSKNRAYIVEGRLYYLVDLQGNYVRNLKTFGNPFVKQGCIDETYIDWITLCPSGTTIKGKMLIAPYWEHFPYETYQVKEKVNIK